MDVLKKTIGIGLIILLNVQCAKKDEVIDSIIQASGVSDYLYVSTGACYSGVGNTTFSNLTSSNLIFRLNLATGQRDLTISDYNAMPANVGDSPAGIVDWDHETIGVLVENTTTTGLRRIELVKKKQDGDRTIFSMNSALQNGQFRRMSRLSDGSLLISKSTAIEKLTSSGIRLTVGANPWVSAPGGSCATSATIITDMLSLPDTGKILFSHATASQNRFGLISTSGYSALTDCKTAVSSPSIAAGSPTAFSYLKDEQKLIVAYAGNSLGDNINAIYVYDVNESTDTISNPIEIYDSFTSGSVYPYLLYGISTMTYHSQTKSLFVASTISTATTAVSYQIDKFSVDLTKLGTEPTKVLTKIYNTPYYEYGYDTKCISSMFIGN